MQKIAMIFSGILMTIGLLTLATSLLMAAIIPNIFRMYLIANVVSFSHDILHPNMTIPYIFSAITITAGIVGMGYFYSHAPAK